MMENPLRLGEHQEKEVSLSHLQVAAIRQLLGSKVDVWATGEPGRYRLKAGSHVGFVQLPEGLTLVIESKVTVETLFALLAAVYDPRREFLREEAQAYTTVEALFEFVTRIFVSHVEDLIARGIVRGYQPLTDDPVAIRGRLLFSETLRHRPVLRDRHWCRHSHFTADVAENRILRWTAFCLQPLRYKEVSVAGGLRRIGLVLAGVKLDPEARRLFERLQYHRLNDPYRPALALARLILDHLTFSGTAGGDPFLAYLVDMNWLFEKYVGEVLRRAAPHWGVNLIEQDRNPLDMRRRVVVEPDVVLYRQGAPHLVIDAKYKLAAAYGDLYQMVAYCHALGLAQAVLVHPASQGAPVGVVSIRGPGAMTVHYLALDLRGDPTQLERQGWALARRVESLLSVQGCPSALSSSE